MWHMSPPSKRFLRRKRLLKYRWSTFRQKLLIVSCGGLAYEDLSMTQSSTPTTKDTILMTRAYAAPTAHVVCYELCATITSATCVCVCGHAHCGLSAPPVSPVVETNKYLRIRSSKKRYEMLRLGIRIWNEHNTYFLRSLHDPVCVVSILPFRCVIARVQCL